MIKPDGVSGNYTEEIKTIVVEAGFNIVKEMLTQLDKETASAFYEEHSSRSFFPHLVTYMTRLWSGVGDGIGEAKCSF
jgi:nucleoside-diphosphate kinase